MSTVLYGAFSLGHSAVEKSQRSFEKNQKLRAVDELLGSYIRSAYPYRASPQGATILFAGEEADLTFVSAFSLAMGGRGMAKVRLFGKETKSAPGCCAWKKKRRCVFQAKKAMRRMKALATAWLFVKGSKSFA